MPNRIQELREEMHMTQVRLSIELGVSQETVCAYEKGKHYPSVAMLIRLSQIFHVSCDYILGLCDTRSAGTEVLSAQEQKLLADFRRLPELRKEKLASYLDGLLACD